MLFTFYTCVAKRPAGTIKVLFWHFFFASQSCCSLRTPDGRPGPAGVQSGCGFSPGACALLVGAVSTPVKKTAREEFAAGIVVCNK